MNVSRWSITRALRAESLKLRGTLCLWACIGAPLLVALLIAFEQSARVPAQFWTAKFSTAFSVWALLLFPLLITLESALAAGLEHNTQAWKHLLALPLPRYSVYLAKVFVVALLAGVATLLVIAATIVVGCGILLTKPALAGAGSPDFAFILPAAARLWLASWLVIALQSWVSLRWPNFTVAIAFGIAATFIALFAYRSTVGAFFPWSLPMLATMAGHAARPLWLGCAGGVAAAALAIAELAGRDEGDTRLPTPKAIFTAVAMAALFTTTSLAASPLYKRIGGNAARIARVESGLTPSLNVKGNINPHTLADRMAFYQVPGVSIAVIDNAKIAWTKAYGVIEAGTTNPVTTETIFQAASISKPVTAMAALAAVDQGRLTTDTDVNDGLRSWKVPENEFTTSKKVTLRGLLSHSAGIVEHRVTGYTPDAHIPSTLETLDGLEPSAYPPIRVFQTPGTRFAYSGGGYLIVQQLMTDVLDKPFPDLMRELVLEKTGMHHSSFGPPSTPNWQASAARGHGPFGLPLPEKWRQFPELAACGLWTTPTDLARFEIELLTCSRGQSQAVFSPAMANQMLTRQLGPCGLGIMLSGDDTGHAFAHEGANVGYRCSMVMNIESGRGAVVMTNGDRGGALMREIMRSIAHEYDWPNFQPTEREAVKIDPALFPRYTGRYRVPNVENGDIVITADRGRLFLQTNAMGPTPLEVFALADNLFFIQEDEGDFHFVLPEGQPQAAALISEYGGRSITANRVE